MNSQYFEFNGEKSIDKNFHIVDFGEDYFKQITYGNRAINGEMNKRALSIIEITDQQIEITITVTKLDYKNNLLEWSEKDISELTKWLVLDDFKELRFGNNPDKTYYAMVSDMSELNLDKNNCGFIEITFTTNSNHCWTNKKRFQNRTTNNKSQFEIFGEHTIGKYYYPTLIIKVLDTTPFKLTNLASGQVIKIDKIHKNEVIKIDNLYKIISSNDKTNNIFKNFNREWLYLKRGSNLLSIDGNVEIEIIAQFPIL